MAPDFEFFDQLINCFSAMKVESAPNLGLNEAVYPLKVKFPLNISIKYNQRCPKDFPFLEQRERIS